MINYRKPVRDDPADMDMLIAVGFGIAQVHRDGYVHLDGEKWMRDGRELRVHHAEEEAKKDPNHNWEIVIVGPLREAVYQRQGQGNWVCVEEGEGFA